MFSPPSPQPVVMPQPSPVAEAPSAPIGQKPGAKSSQPTFLAGALTPTSGQKGTATLLGSTA
jgi:hypothetical protein